MTDTDTFCFVPSSRGPTIAAAANSKLKMDPRYFQNQPPPPPPHISKVQPSSIWNMIHRGGLFAPATTTTTATAKTNPIPVSQMSCKQQKATTIATMQSQNKDLVDMMDEQLRRLTTDLVKYSHPPNAPQQMDTLWDYLDTMERVDLDMDEHLSAPVYFTGDEMEVPQKPKEQKDQQQSSPSFKKQQQQQHSTNGFLPTAFNSLRSIFGNVFRLPSLIMSTWHDDDSNPAATPQHHHHHNNQYNNHSSQQHLFFDVDDIDFLPDETTPEHSNATNTAHDDDIDGGCQYEAFFLDVHNDDHYNNGDSFDKPNNYETKHSAVVVGPLVTAATASVVALNRGPNYMELDNQSVETPLQVPEKTKTCNNSTTTAAIITPKLSSPVDIVKTNADATSCTRRFVSTPDQECSRMAVVRPRKRQAPIRTALVTRSTPIAVRSGSAAYRPQLRLSKRTLDKNRKEKRRHEIATNISEDYGASSDSETGLGATVVVVQSETDDDDHLLPLTARNLMEPSCLLEFCGMESSMNSSGGGSVGRSVGGGFSAPRRNSINFQTAAYEKEFPVMLDRRGGEGREDVAEKRDELLVVTRKENGAVYFEIPNSPQRRRLLVPRKLLKPAKQRTNSVMSSSVGSSPATSFDACGKFWGGGGRRVRTVSEGSEDDLIEFVAESGCTDYLADVFSDTDMEDEDYSSDEEEEEGEEESGEDSDTEEEEDLEYGRRIRDQGCLEVDLPDSGVEEKKVSGVVVNGTNEYEFIFSIFLHIGESGNLL